MVWGMKKRAFVSAALLAALIVPLSGCSGADSGRGGFTADVVPATSTGAVSPSESPTPAPTGSPTGAAATDDAAAPSPAGAAEGPSVAAAPSPAGAAAPSPSVAAEGPSVASGGQVSAAGQAVADARAAGTPLGDPGTSRSVELDPDGWSDPGQTGRAEMIGRVPDEPRVVPYRPAVAGMEELVGAAQPRAGSK